MRCDLTAQYRKYKDEINTAIQRVLESGRYTLAEEVSAFEADFADYLGCTYAIGVGNATDGLIISMKAFGIGEGDEVITTPFTAIPTVSAIVATGAKPVFVDIDEKTFLIDIYQIPNFITSRTKAIVPVHIFGNVVDIEGLKRIIPDDIPIIEDAAQAHGSKINGKHAGSIGDIGVFSFYPTKNLGGYGDGGAIVTINPEIAERIKLMRMYGMIDKDHIVINGVNSRLDELQAAILRVKLRHLDQMNQRRNEIVKEYKRNLDSRYFTFQQINNNVYCNFHVLTARIGVDRDNLLQYLDKHNIQSNVYYPIPLHLQDANRYLAYSRGDFPKVEKLCDEAIALPIYPELPDQSLRDIITTLKEFSKK